MIKNYVSNKLKSTEYSIAPYVRYAKMYALYKNKFHVIKTPNINSFLASLQQHLSQADTWSQYMYNREILFPNSQAMWKHVYLWKVQATKWVKLTNSV